MGLSRVIGRNIQLAMKKHNVDISEIQKRLGYSERDVYRILEGVLLVDTNDLEKFAKVLDVQINELIEKKDEKCYRSLVHCMGEYHDESNKDKILDYIDFYIELAEAVG